MNKYYISIIALSFCGISTPLLSAEKNSKFIPKLQIQQKTGTAIKPILFKNKRLKKSIAPKVIVAPKNKMQIKAKLPAIQRQIKKLPATQRQTRILPKANKASLADRINKTRLQNRAKLLAPKTTRRVRTLGGIIKKDQQTLGNTRLSGSRHNKLPTGTQSNLNLSGTGSKLGRIKELGENLQQLENLRRLRQFEEMQNPDGNLLGNQSAEQQFGSDHIDLNSPASPENQIGQGADCALSGGSPADCFSNAAGSSGADGARIGSGQPGGATDGFRNPNQGQASKDPSQGGDRYIFNLDGSETEITTGNGIEEFVTFDKNGNLTMSGQTFYSEKGVSQGGTISMYTEDGTVSFTTDAEGNETVTTTDAEGNEVTEPDTDPVEQSNPEDDHSGSGNDCGLRAGDCEQQPAIKDMIGQPADGGNDVAGTGSATAGAVTRNAVINPGDGSYQASGSGGGGRAPSVIGTMPDPNPVPGTPVGASR